MLSVHKKTLWYAALLLALLLLLGGSLVLLYQRVVLASVAVKDAGGAIAILEYQERSIGNNKRGLEELSASLDALKSSFVSPDTFVQFVELMEQLAQDSAVAFQAQGATLPSPSLPGEKTAMRFEVEGSYTALVRFFIMLDAIPYAGFVQEVRIAPAGKGTDTLRASVTFTVFNFSPIL